MKIRLVASKKEILSLSKDDTIFHLSFQPSMNDLFNLVQRCPKIKANEIASHRHKVIGEYLQTYIRSTDIQLLKGNLQAQCIGANTHYKVPDSVIKTIKQLKKEGRSEDEIVRKVSGIGKLSENMLRFIIKG